MQDDWLAQSFVAPSGRQHTVQYGVEVNKGRTLKELLTCPADSSVHDLNPELCTNLRMRLTHDKY